MSPNMRLTFLIYFFIIIIFLFSPESTMDRKQGRQIFHSSAKVFPFCEGLTSLFKLSEWLSGRRVEHLNNLLFSFTTELNI